MSFLNVCQAEFRSISVRVKTFLHAEIWIDQLRVDGRLFVQFIALIYISALRMEMKKSDLIFRLKCKLFQFVIIHNTFIWFFYEI